MKAQRRSSRMRTRKGVVVALIGPDASGKTTLVKKMAARLKPDFEVYTAHFGWTPQEQRPTRHLRTAILAMRKVVRISRRERTIEGVEHRYPTFETLLDVCTAIDRWLSAFKCRRARAEGAVVLADRYPTRVPGAANGPRRLRDPRLTTRIAHRIECAVYRSIPQPDLVLRLEVPLEQRIQRNLTRGSEYKDERAVLTSHEGVALVAFPGVREVAVNTAQSLEDTEEQVWTILREYFDHAVGGLARPARRLAHLILVGSMSASGSDVHRIEAGGDVESLAWDRAATTILQRPDFVDSRRKKLSLAIALRPADSRAA